MWCSMMLNWKPDKHSSIPLHKQIVDYMKEKIMMGEWTVGCKIPTQRKLAAAFNVNRSTVVTALEELKAEGLIEGRSGGGTKVINNTWSLMTLAPPPNWNAYVEAGIHPPNLPTIQEINRAEFDPAFIRLGTGELAPELIPVAFMGQIIGQSYNRLPQLGYEEPKGSIRLREQLSSYLRAKGIYASPSSILIVSGALQALQLISLGILHKGSTILLEKPSYLNSLHVFQSAVMNLEGVPMDEDGIKASLIPHYKKSHAGALLYTIPSFHNPTGAVMSLERRMQLLEVCRNEQLPIIEDDVYGDLWLDEKGPEPLKASDQSGSVLYLGSLSKTVSPGLRIGWVVGPEAVISRLADIKMQTDYGSSSLSQWVAAEWFSTGLYEEHLTQVREQLKERRQIALQTLIRHFSEIAEWNEPKGGFYIWLRILPKINTRELFKKAMEHGILLNPGNVYDVHASQFLRISYSYASASDLEKGLQLLSTIIKKR